MILASDYDGTFHVTPVYEKSFKISVSPRDDRPSNEAADTESIFFKIHFQQAGRHFPAINAVNDLVKPATARRAQLFLPVADKAERDVWMRQGQPHQQVLYMSGLGHGGLQKLPARRHVIKQLADDERRPVRHRGLFQGMFLSSLYHVTRTRHGVPRLGQQFHPGDGGDAR